MIKKSLFEKELEAGMQQELRKIASSETPDLVKAAECVHAAIEILEEAGLTSRADELLTVLEKIAVSSKTKPVMEMAPFNPKMLMEAGVTQRDLIAFNKGEPPAVAKVNLALHNLGYPEHAIKNLLGHRYMSKKDAADYLDPNRNFTKMWEWMKDPTQPIDPSSPQPGESLTMSRVPQSQFTPLPGDEIKFQSLTQPTAPPAPGEESLEFKSIAAKHRKPKNPLSIKDPHVKGLTPDQQVKNLLNHGTQFNMADDMSADFDPDIASALGVDRADDFDMADDLGNMNVADDMLEVTDEVPLHDFEDERD